MICNATPFAGIADFAGNTLFSGIPRAVLETLGSEIELLSFNQGDIIFAEGDTGDAMYLVGEGCVRISKTGRGGKQETLGHIAAGSFFGEMALLDGQPRSAQACAAEPSVVGRLREETFQDILEVAPRAFHMNFLRSVVDRLRRVNSHFITEVARAERLSLVGSMAGNIIHDLKTPVGVIQCCSDLIAARATNPRDLEYAVMINKSVENIVGMTQEILDFSRGKSCIEPANIPVCRLMEALDCQVLRRIPAHIHLVKEIRYQGDLRIDLPRFVRVLCNLVKNSLEAMPKRGLLRIEVDKTADRIVVSIGDTGCGIAPELQAEIFEPFVTFGKSHGTGLGMAIAKSVVEAHGGKIVLESRVGEGTKVEVRLPLPGE